jgi:hypothetical protein
MHLVGDKDFIFALASLTVFPARKAGTSVLFQFAVDICVAEW